MEDLIWGLLRLGRFLIRLLLRLLLRLFRVWRVKHWCSTAATIMRAVVVKVDAEWAPMVLYTFTVNSHEYMGEFFGMRCKKAEARWLASRVQPDGHIVVRFKPKNPDQNIALNGDNRKGLPFKIAG